jgi:ATP-dependent helicase YprA (DUF1998 family)/very-short-patch-repair endonuclease
VNVFDLRERLVKDYADYTRSFVVIRDERIRELVDRELDEGRLWPDPILELNPAFEPGETVDELVDAGILHGECARIFRRDKTHDDPRGKPLRLHRHQAEAIKLARTGANYVLTTGTGSGKSLTYIIPIVDHVLRRGSGKGIQAIVVYPMNALANSQVSELEKFLRIGYPNGRGPITFARYTGQEKDEERDAIAASPPDILLTNYAMLELILTRPFERTLVQAANGLRFLVLDELHTYRGRQGADVALLARRVREATDATALQCVGASATLAGPGTLVEQREEVARVASLLFGAEVQPEHVIGETLRRATRASHDAASLRARVEEASEPPGDYEALIADPLASWLETTLGLAEEAADGRLVRAEPKPLTGPDSAAERLAQITGLPEPRCLEAIRETLLAGYRILHPETGFPTFAFRVHQFFSRGETVYASLEPEGERHVTTVFQQYVPGSRERLLFPLAFCYECGQEYYTVRLQTDPGTGGRVFAPRQLNDVFADDGTEAAFVYASGDQPWPEDPAQQLDRVPDDWIEIVDGSERIKPSFRQYLPVPALLGPDGRDASEGLACHIIPAPFRFCLRCGVAHAGRRPRDFGKLLTLGAGGRSSGTTILSLAAIRSLRVDDALPEKARKLLSFTDNRQDASLQAGHFNDFVEVGLLRSALFRAAAEASHGLAHDELPMAVFNALDLPLELYALDPGVRFAAREETDRALRDVLGYRLYRDLERGWRITAPNLEQCGLLEIEYVSLEELSRADDVWQTCHPALASASPEQRAYVAKTLLDYMRRELCIKVDYLDRAWQEGLRQRAGQRLRDPWAIDENEELEHAAVLYPRPRRRAAQEYRGNVFVSARGGFGQFLRRASTFPSHRQKLSLDETDTVIRDLLEALRVAGLTVVVDQPSEEGQVPGYQVPAAAMRWKAGDGTRAFHDPIRIPNLPDEGGRTNAFFVDFYRQVAAGGQGIRAREHTAQVPAEERERREEEFREARLPVLFCSPTMELGVDIAELNVVGMRNVPPTPANYAQRSGRAGRSGQPALVFNYCAAGNSHDQYFFRRPTLMVSGKVRPPRLDLTNEDLVKSHLHAIWLAETGQSLGTSLADVLDLSGEEPTLALKDSLHAAIANPSVAARARPRCEHLVASIPGLEAAEWYSERWLDGILAGAALAFDEAANRWRELYRAALQLQATQHKVILDASRPAYEKETAKRLRAQAETQLALLRGEASDESRYQSDFYSYRYFASEGFLPGYNFPRLPLSAFIPGRRGRDEFVQRPRFLAISEFGPRSIVYHEGSRYVINRVLLPAARLDDSRLPTVSVKRCSSCGYLHPIEGREPGPDLCERCNAPLDPPILSLLRLQNVSTKRRDRINSDEEERVRQGFEILAGVRFTRHDGLGERVAQIVKDGTGYAKLAYGSAATLWRINVGWSRRANHDQLGFVLDTERGYWARNDQVEVEDRDDPMSAVRQRVIPYVEDRRNALLFQPVPRPWTTEEIASLAAALKAGIQAVFQLEETELAVEPLPSRDFRHLILFYESAEGGAGVLRQLVTDRDAFAEVARTALDLCHFERLTGADLRRAPGAKEDCEAACYDCLLSYQNQADHRLLDRKLIKDRLLDLAAATVEISPVHLSREQHLERMLSRCDTELERDFLRFLDQHGLELPSDAQYLIGTCRARPDFYYAAHQTAVFLDGPVHDYRDVSERDGKATARLEDAGYTVVRFRHDEDWEAIVARYPSTFGRLREPA